MNDIISLFDGMSCGQIAFQDMGIKIKNYYASEIDKFAIAQTQLNFPETIQLGNIENWREWDIDWSAINLILAGSPCQGFSFAGKQLNFDDPRSKLFFVFVDILNHCKKYNPDVKFLLENVVMKKEYQRVINNTLGLFPVRINSNLVSAQNRDRLYWTNMKIKMVGLFNEIHSDIPQPKDRGILLKDILQPENEIDEKYYLSGKALTGLDINKKAPTQRSSTGRCLDEKHNYQIIKVDKQGNKKADQTKAGCLTGGGHYGGNHSDMDIICIGGYKDGKIMKGTSKDFSQSQRIWNTDGKGRTLDATPGGFGGKTGLYLDNCKLRRLTPLECARLQTVPSWYKWQCSDTQQYKMLGNGWTISVIKHILSFL